MKEGVLKRMEYAERVVKNRPARSLRKLVSKMTTAELFECLDDNTTESRLQAIVRRAAKQ